MSSPAASVLLRHYACSVLVPASVDDVFAYADEPAHLASHMSQSSPMMGGGSMRVDTDSEQGKSVGSHIRLAGHSFGIDLFLEEVVTERDPPRYKAWETIGMPNLIIIGHYRMGFDVAAQGDEALLTVFIDYALPTRSLSRWLGYLFADFYARWCTRQMANAVVRHFHAARLKPST